MAALAFPNHARRPLEPALRAALAAQNPHLDAEVLASPRLGVVATGQQVGLFLGPAYSIYKAITALALAKRLTRRGEPTIAVFWLQSEDHDHPEIASASVLDEADELETVRAGATGHERGSMAQRALTDDVSRALSALAEHLRGAPHRDATLELLSRHYQPGVGWVDAFAGALGEVLGPRGLWVLNPRCPELAHEAMPIHRRALLEHAAIQDATLRGAAAVDEVGVEPREGCALCFVHPEGPHGPRFRPTRCDQGWTWPGAEKPVASEALLARLEDDPLSFSTSSLLRLMLQEYWLPTIAHVVGPGEARYVRQAPPLHAHYDLIPPPPIPRGRFVVTERTDRRKLEALGLEASEVGEEEPLLRRLASGDPGPDGQAVAQRLQAALERELAPLAVELTEVDPGLDRAVQRTRKHVHKGMNAFARRIDRARARRDDIRTTRVRALCSRLSPHGAPQERALTFPHFAARYSWSAWLDAISEGVENHLDEVEDGAEGQLLEIVL